MRRLLLASDEDDAYGWLRRHPLAIAQGNVTAIVWPGRFHTLEGGQVFDRLAVTAEAWYLDAAIAACLTRVRGRDGLTPGQRLGVNEALEASIARHPAGRDHNG